MKTEKIPYTEGADAFDAFLARPADPGDHPAVLVFHAFGGRDDFAEAKAKKLAELGYVGAAIDLYGLGKRGTDRASRLGADDGARRDPPKLRRRIAAAYQAVRLRRRRGSGRMGAIGFAGGMCALLGARMGLAPGGVVSFHGLLKIGEPLDEKVRARLLVLHGQDDPIPPADVGAFAEEIKRIDAD
ncbi:MAG: dienelactone hydrolase family protein [Sandaracinaceae bacterium]